MIWDREIDVRIKALLDSRLNWRDVPMCMPNTSLRARRLKPGVRVASSL